MTPSAFLLLAEGEAPILLLAEGEAPFFPLLEGEMRPGRGSSGR